MTQVHRSRPSAPSGMYIQDLDLSCEATGDDTATGEASVGPFLRGPTGAVRLSVLATLADVVAGLPACRATAPRLALTLDIAVHSVGQPTGDRVRLAARLLKAGRNTIAAAVDVVDASSGMPVAVCHLTFVPSPRPQDTAPVLRGGMRMRGTLDAPLPEQVGARVSAPGVAEIDHRPYVTQNSGTLQGGIVALLAELAAESLAGGALADLDTRYLSAVRTGPGRAVATRAGADLLRVEVRDAGADDRLAAAATARVAGRGAVGGPA